MASAKSTHFRGTQALLDEVQRAEPDRADDGVAVLVALSGKHGDDRIGADAGAGSMPANSRALRRVEAVGELADLDRVEPERLHGLERPERVILAGAAEEHADTAARLDVGLRMHR